MKRTQLSTAIMKLEVINQPNVLLPLLLLLLVPPNPSVVQSALASSEKIKARLEGEPPVGVADLAQGSFGAPQVYAINTSTIRSNKSRAYGLQAELYGLAESLTSQQDAEKATSKAMSSQSVAGKPRKAGAAETVSLSDARTDTTSTTSSTSPTPAAKMKAAKTKTGASTSDIALDRLQQKLSTFENWKQKIHASFAGIWLDERFNDLVSLGGGGGKGEGGGRGIGCVRHSGENKIFSYICEGSDITEVPQNLDPSLMSLQLSRTGIEKLSRNSLTGYKETLRDFSMESAPKLVSIEPHTFEDLKKLRVVYIFHAPKLVSFDMAVSGLLPDLAIITIQQSALRHWPDLSRFRQDRILNSIDLDNNMIASLGDRPLNVRAELLNLEFNRISSIEEFTFNGSEIGVLSLKGNYFLTTIHPNSFSNLRNLVKLDLSGTSISQLPTQGIHHLRSLIIRDTYTLKRIPSIYEFPLLEEAHLTYAFHCCSFRYPQTHDPSAYTEHLHLQAEIDALCAANQGTNYNSHSAHSSSSTNADLKRPSSADNSQPPSPADSQKSGDSDFEGTFEEYPVPAVGGSTGFTVVNAVGLAQAPGASSESPLSIATTTAATTARIADTGGSRSGGGGRADGAKADQSLGRHWLTSHNIECGELAIKHSAFPNISCTPEPDDFNPCEDIMGYPILRVAVWFVVAAAVFGNLSVIVVLAAVFRRLSVPKFLQLNLAVGDLVMGVYLATLALADLSTKGSYFNYAIDWQYGYGCMIAGAASLFASQLSIFTLSVITFERYYTITYSIDLNMRLQLGWAARIMLLGWLYAFVSATLPIFANINSYSKTSICLPLRTSSRSDRVFLFVLIFIDSMAFVIIFACYLKMYLLILRQKTEATAKERTVAMRMALLVSTDFACWAPIIFFGTTALLGRPLISVTNSKILIVFFYPLNSMANPFLYVISTRQYKRDLNYLTSRWQAWRRNLFRSKDESYYSNRAYAISQYPMNNLNAHLGAVAAVTGVANHLRRVQVKPHSECLERKQRVVCTKSHQGQYIIRHQILTDRHLSSRYSPHQSHFQPATCRRGKTLLGGNPGEFVNLSSSLCVKDSAGASETASGQQVECKKISIHKECLESTCTSSELACECRRHCGAGRRARRVRCPSCAAKQQCSHFQDTSTCQASSSDANSAVGACLTNQQSTSSMPPLDMMLMVGESKLTSAEDNSERRPTEETTRLSDPSTFEPDSPIKRPPKLSSARNSSTEKESSVDILGNISYDQTSSFSGGNCSTTATTSQAELQAVELISTAKPVPQTTTCHTYQRDHCRCQHWRHHHCKHHQVRSICQAHCYSSLDSSRPSPSTVDQKHRSSQLNQNQSNNLHHHYHHCRRHHHRKRRRAAQKEPHMSLRGSTPESSTSKHSRPTKVPELVSESKNTLDSEEPTVARTTVFESIASDSKTNTAETVVRRPDAKRVLESILKPPRRPVGLIRAGSLQTDNRSRVDHDPIGGSQRVRTKKKVSIVSTHSR